MTRLSFPDRHLDALCAILEREAKQEILPRFLHTGVAQREKTSSFDIVTEADEAMERAVTRALTEAFPDAFVLGEEACAGNPALLATMDQHPFMFVLDPLDGTRNFASGLPLFWVMVAVVLKGRTVAAVIHDPVTQTTARALAGEGAWLLRPGVRTQRLRVAPPRPVAAMDCIVGTMFLPQPLRDEVNGRLSRLGAHTWYRCAAHEYRLAASGTSDALVYNKLMPWDHAAGVLLHQEAGGYSAFLDGEPYRPTRHAGGLICAPDRASWQALKDALFSQAAPGGTPTR
jgi:fructose-1,6-bisphosphatase/inositol monophosphatase family enzyme